MISLILVAILLGTIAVALGLWVMFKFLVNYQPGPNRISKDLKKMTAEIQPWIDELVPWSADEMELLSQNQINKSVKKGMTTEVKGVLTSVYNEPLVAYSFKKYLGEGSNAVLFARTSKHNFFYRIRRNETELHINGQKVGKLNKDGQLFSYKSGQLLAEIVRDKDALVLPILVNDKEVGAMLRKQEAMNVNPRAFEFLNQMKNKEETLSLALALKELINEELPPKSKIQ